MSDTPKIEYRTITKNGGDPGYVNRLLIGTPTTGIVRMEWATARWGQIIPTNYSMVQMMQYVDSCIAIGYNVANAQNAIVNHMVKDDFQWLLLIEHDTILPPDALVRFNDYIRKADTPVVSGLYYTRSIPSEPLVYRGRGTSYYDDWQLGDRVWCDGVPTGCLLIHGGLLRTMWDEAEEYTVNGERLRRVFRTPEDLFIDPETGQFNMTAGTSDLDWCTKVMEGDYFKKSGWDQYQQMRWPFLVDTNIFCRHINIDGESFP